MRVGITGHINLSERTVPLVAQALHEHLHTLGATPLTGVSCLARGADSVFAEVVLELGGRLEVVLPSADYRKTKVSPGHAAQFDRLISQADQVQTMPFEVGGQKAYAAANDYMLNGIEELVAIWDGQPSPNRGGTAAAVELARAKGITVHIIWPDGASRTGGPGRRRSRPR